MVATLEPAVERRRLRIELRKMRQDAGLTQQEVAAAMDWSPSKVIRIENGSVGISSNDLRVLLDHYGVGGSKARVGELLEMAKIGRKDPWSEFKDVHSAPYLAFLGYEASAARIRDFQTLILPGLLVIEEYARAVAAGVTAMSRDGIDRRWEARVRRQELHERERPPEMSFILDEAVIRRTVGGPGVMRRQLEHLQALSAEKHVTLRVVPFSQGAHAGLRGNFVVLEFDDPEDDAVLYLEDARGTVTTRDDAETTASELERFFDLETVALSPRDSLALIDDAIAGLDAGTAVPTQKESDSTP